MRKQQASARQILGPLGKEGTGRLRRQAGACPLPRRFVRVSGTPPLYRAQRRPTAKSQLATKAISLDRLARECNVELLRPLMPYMWQAMAGRARITHYYIAGMQRGGTTSRAGLIPPKKL